MRTLARMARHAPGRRGGPRLAPAACILAAAALAGGQASPPAVRPEPGEIAIHSQPFLPQPLLVADVQSVQIAATVHDRDGHPVTGLGENDFRVLDNGVPQVLTSFAVEGGSAAVPGGAALQPGTAATAAAPRVVMLLFDDLDTDVTRSMALANAQQQARAYVRAALGPGVRIGILTSSGKAFQPFTGDASALEAALNRIRPASLVEPMCGPQPMGALRSYELAVQHYPPKLANSPTGDCARIEWSEYEQEQPLLLAAIDRAISLLGREPGTRILLLASPGFVSINRNGDEEMIEQDALQHGVVVNSLMLRQPGFVAQVLQPDPARMLTLTSGMYFLSAATGGRLIDSDQYLRNSMAELSQPPAEIYAMSFTPSHLVHDGSFHTLTVLTPGYRNLTVDARGGYLAPGGALGPSTSDLRQRLNAEVLASDAPAELGVTHAFDPAPAAGTLALRLTLAVKNLPWLEWGARSLDQVTVAAVLFAANGQAVGGKESTITFRLGPKTLAGLEKTGFTGTMTLAAPPASYGLRCVVIESAQGKVTAFTEPVVIH